MTSADSISNAMLRKKKGMVSQVLILSLMPWLAEKEEGDGQLGSEIRQATVGLRDSQLVGYWIREKGGDSYLVKDSWVLHGSETTERGECWAR